MNTNALINLSFDYTREPDDALPALLVERFVAGGLPHARAKWIQRVRKRATLRPEGSEPAFTWSKGCRHVELCEGDGWMLLVERTPPETASVTVAAATAEDAVRILQEVTRNAAARTRKPNTVPISFWHAGTDGPECSSRPVDAPDWSSVRKNYTGRVANAFDRLTELDVAAADAKLVLLHGPPGTGKTTALRALARAWRKWCRFEVVVDAENLFGSSGYLMRVLLGDEDDSDKRWRVLVLEDCDELLRSDAKRQTGQSLGRLLNLTDGFLGQGRKLLIALSTNEPLAALHPAIVRPGRCLAEVHVDRLSRSEAVKWLGPGYEAPANGATLAELYAIKRETGPVRAPELQRVSGTYL